MTAACMMMKKKVFEKAGGFTEELAVAFNDVDLCLKVRKEDFLIVYDPYAERIFIPHFMFHVFDDFKDTSNMTF